MAIYRLSGPAEKDLDNIWLYIAQSDLNAANSLIDAIIESLLLLAENPLMGRERGELSPQLRSIPVGSYLIFHRPIDNGIEVVRVLHGARNLQALFAEEN